MIKHISRWSYLPILLILENCYMKRLSRVCSQKYKSVIEVGQAVDKNMPLLLEFIMFVSFASFLKFVIVIYFHILNKYLPHT